MRIKNLLLYIIILLGSTFVLAVQPSKDYTVYTVPPAAPLQTYLYFQGNVEPINSYRVISPIAGVVSEDLNFNYGATVNKNQYLLSIAPSDEENSYRTALLAYLRAKSNYSQSLAKYSGQELLYKNKILARNDFAQYQNTLVDQQLTMQEALHQLKAVIQKISNNKQTENNLINNLSSLSLDDKKVTAALNQSFNEVKINAPIGGVALLPPKESESDAATTALQKNSVVKLNQILLTIGDLSGLKINLNVNEVSVNKLQVGQAAEITGPAFPGIILAGKIATISYQANNMGNSGEVPQFPVVVAVPQLTPQQQKIIHAGMTAQVKIILDQGRKILIPINAVKQQDEKAYVEKMVNGVLVTTPVITGQTTLTEVEIVSGLQAGDQLAIPH